MFHRHTWTLADKTIIPHRTAALKVESCSEKTFQRIALGYVVLTFTCPCGQYRIEER